MLEYIESYKITDIFILGMFLISPLIFVHKILRINEDFYFLGWLTL
jgi:hypothetical protein